MDEFFDTTSLIIVTILLLAVILFFILKKRKKSWMYVKIVFAIAFVGGITFGIFHIYQRHNYFDVENHYEYVYGKIEKIENNRINLYSITSSYNKGGRGNIQVKIHKNTEIIDGYMGSSDISIKDLKVGNIVRIFCKENEVKNSSVSAVKIVMIEK